jgi:hypothetical protein
MVISQEQKKINAARELTSKSELKRIRLRRCSCVLEGEENTLKAPFGLAESHNATAYAVIDQILRIEVGFRFQGFDASEGRVSLFSIECSFELDYEIEHDYQPAPEAVEAFKDGNAVFNCWPYARECVQSITSRMALIPPPLPLLRMVPKKAEPKTDSPMKAASPQLSESEPTLTTPASKE